MGRILIIEDQQDVFENLERHLCKTYPDYEIKTAVNCDEGFRVIKNSIQKNNLSLVILDLTFNIKSQNVIIPDGKSLLKELKKNNYKIPVVVYTSHDESILVASILDNFNINGFVVKSYNSTKELLFAIEKALEGDYFYSHSINKLIQNKLKFKNVIDGLDMLILEKLPNTTSKKQWEVAIPNASSPSGFISYNAIKTRLDKIKDVLNVDNDKQLVLKLRQIGFI